jgi:type VI protein secretion system component VasK
MPSTVFGDMEVAVLGLAADELVPTSLLGPLVMMIGIVGVGVLLTISIRGKIARRNAARPSARQLIEQVKTVRLSSDDVEVKAAELMETARRLSAQLDNKAQRLEKLIGQADERIAVMSAAPRADIHRATDAPAEPQPPASPAPRERDPLTRAVYELADQGRTPLEIAQELDEQVGKIELIIALRAA